MSGPPYIRHIRRRRPRARFARLVAHALLAIGILWFSAAMLWPK